MTRTCTDGRTHARTVHPLQLRNLIALRAVAVSADESPKTTRGPHPPHCRACAGTGFVEGAPLVTRAGGRDISSPSLARCEHDWWYDEPVLPEPLPPGDPRAHAALARGLAEGIAERQRAAEPEPEQTRLDL